MAPPDPMFPSPPSDRVEEFHYLPVSEEMHAWECFATTVGGAVYEPGAHYPHRGHPSFYNFDWATGRVLPEYMLVLITEGAGVYEIRKGETATCVQGDMLQIASGQWHRYRPAADSGWAELWLGLGGEYTHRLHRKGLAFTETCLSLGDRFDGVKSALLNLTEIVRGRANFNSPLLSSEAFRIIALLSRACQDGKPRNPCPTEGDACVSQALEYIWTNSHRPIHVADVAAAAGINPRMLERRFAATHKCSVRQEIEWSRFFRARRLLRNTKLPVKEIAYACGFTDPRRMFEVFRRREGVTPSEVREQS